MVVSDREKLPKNSPAHLSSSQKQDLKKKRGPVGAHINQQQLP